MTADLRIGDVARLLAITPRAIRHYHARGLLPVPPRTPAGYRLYGLADLERLRRILRLQSMGLSLRQIAFILAAAEPDALLHRLLQEREQQLDRQIRDLQQQQQAIQAYLQAGAALAEAPPAAGDAAVTILHDRIRPQAAGLAALVLATEQSVLEQVDHYAWAGDYAAFWEAVAGHMLRLARPHEHQIILWLERYLALAAFAPEDPQGCAWLQELRHSPQRRIMAQVWRLPPSPHLAPEDQQRLTRLIRLSMFAQGNALQQQFLALLNTD
jgi:DNA-binding transcriptional MerR regulator